MALVAWTPDDEENWQQMMDRLVNPRPGQRPKPKTAAADRSARLERTEIAPDNQHDEGIWRKTYLEIAPSRNLQLNTGEPSAGMRKTQSSLVNSSLLSQPTGQNSTLASQPQLSTGTYGHGGLPNQNGTSPTSAQSATQNGSDYVESIKRRALLEGLAGLYGVNRQLLGQAFEATDRLKPPIQVDPTALTSANSHPTIAPVAWHPPQQDAAGGRQVLNQGAPQGKDVPVPYPPHGWNFVSPGDRKKVEDMRRSGDQAGVNVYAKDVAERAHRDHPVEMWLPYGPNLPSTRASVRDVDNLEHSPEWEQVSPQERTALAKYLATGRVEAANQYARELRRDAQASMAKHNYSEPLPPVLPRHTPPLAPEFWDTARINKLRGYQAANIIANENRDVMPGPSAPEDLQEAKVAQAHAVINADRNFGDARRTLVKTAPDEIRDGKFANSEQYQQALNAVRTARQQDLQGIDPTGGRMPFNNRYDTPDKNLRRTRRIGSEKVNVHQAYGPFALGKKPTYVVLNDNTQDLMRRIERMNRNKSEKK